MVIISQKQTLLTLKEHPNLGSILFATYTRQKKKRTTTIFPLRSPFNTKMLIIMKYSFLIKFYYNLNVTEMSISTFPV